MTINVLRLNHVAIACKDTRPMAAFFRDILRLSVSERVAQPEHGVYTTFVEFPKPVGSNTDRSSMMSKVELIEPLGGDASPIAKFVAKSDGGIHHFCFEVEDLAAAIKHLQDKGIKPLAPPKLGAHGLPVVFLHPRDCHGLLTELEQRE